MEIQQIKKQLARIGQAFGAVAEMCERHASVSQVNGYLATIHQDSVQLKSMVEHNRLDDRFGYCVQHLQATTELLMKSGETIGHKDTRAALRKLTGEVESLGRVLQ